MPEAIGSNKFYARGGDYKNGTSDFYTNLRSQIDAGSGSVFTPTQREKLKPLLAERDAVITLLARSDPAAADRLFAIYSSYNKLTMEHAPRGGF